MNILVTGSNGQLGNEIRVISDNYPQHRYFFTDAVELDICDKIATENFVVSNHITAIINCAAYTAVDNAEDDIDLCYKINRDAVKNLGEITEKYKLKIIHISTDYVFDGTNHIPYTEKMTVKPVGVYGKSKQEGESELLKACPNSIIIRTSWLYSSFGNNFVKTMLKLGKERSSLNVIFDQTGTPTYARDLAEIILKIISSEKTISGIFHFSNEGVCSWYDFVKAIHRIAKIECNVKPIETKDYLTKAIRPHYSVLNKHKIKNTLEIEIPYWQESLEKCIKIILS